MLHIQEEAIQLQELRQARPFSGFVLPLQFADFLSECRQIEHHAQSVGLSIDQQIRQFVLQEHR